VVCLVKCFLTLVDEQFVISDDSRAIMEGIEWGGEIFFLARTWNVNGETILVRSLLELFTRLAV
jgi:hypothetical protein